MDDAAIKHFERDGFAIIQNVVAHEECEKFARVLDQLVLSRSSKRHGGIRNLLQISSCVRDFAGSHAVWSLMAAVMRVDHAPFPARALLFDKTPVANWAVSWHQDLHIAVAERIETPGFGPWSVKAGVTHVQPPAEILSRMVTVRLHLDDCDETNGALRVIPGSHASGILTAPAAEVLGKREAVICGVRRGGLLLMRPLLLHASTSASIPSHRRVLHIEYACDPLPNGLCWHDAE